IRCSGHAPSNQYRGEHHKCAGPSMPPPRPSRHARPAPLPHLPGSRFGYLARRRFASAASLCLLLRRAPRAAGTVDKLARAQNTEHRQPSMISTTASVCGVRCSVFKLIFRKSLSGLVAALICTVGAAHAGAAGKVALSLRLDTAEAARGGETGLDINASIERG